MYYKNLRAEFIRNEVTREEVMELLDIGRGAYYSKLSGRTGFTLKEVQLILGLMLEKSGKAYSIDYLFKTNATEKK